MSESKPVVLRSNTNPTIRHLLRMRDNRARRKAGRVLVDGWRETALALNAGLIPCGLYTTESDLAIVSPTEADRQSILQHPQASQIITRVSESIMQRISYGQSARGMVAEFEQPRLSVSQIDLPPNPFILILDQIEKPGNVGAVYRCADAAGVDAVLLCESQDPFNPNSIRNSLGTVFHVPSGCGSESELAEFLIQHQVRVLAARPQSSNEVWATDLRGPLAVVVGNEATGLGQRWERMGDCDVAGIRIPMRGKIDSLNVSVSAAVIAFEAQRQRSTAEID